MANKRCLLVDVSSAENLRSPIDWEKCILCQSKTAEKLLCPAASKRSDVGIGYTTLAAALTEFDLLNALPVSLKLANFDEGSGIEAAFVTHQAKWHKSCRVKYSANMLARMKVNGEKCATLSETNDDSSCPLNIKRRKCTRSVFSVGCDISPAVCFFCDQQANTEPLHEVTTLELDDNVRKCAHLLHDEILLAKLATRDMVAQEAKYHVTCLAKLYNDKRAFERSLVETDFESTSLQVAHSVAFAQLVVYIDEIRSITTVSPVFKLADLSKLYTQRLQQMGVDITARVNTTKLKEKLLAHFVDMQAHHEGRDVVLAFADDIGAALFKACSHDSDQDAFHLTEAAKIVRREMFNSNWTYHDNFHPECQQKAVPQSLLALVSMILEGPSIDMQAVRQNVSGSLTVSQLIVFNSVKNKRVHDSITDQVVHHNKSQETPLPLYIGLLVHATTRKKSLIDRLFHLGICVSYDRVLSMTTELANRVCELFTAERAVCPANLRTNVFTTAAVDNIDHNPTSTSARGSFHGTGISLMQHPDKACDGLERNTVTVRDRNEGTRVLSLPDFYTNIAPTSFRCERPEVPSITGALTSSGALLPNAMLAEQSWLETVRNQLSICDTDESLHNISWSAYHASREEQKPIYLTVSAMLPLFQESAHTVSMIRHSIDIVSRAVHNLNPGQVPIVTFDQPLYTLAKEIQWNWPETYGEDKLVVMFGGLHVEMAVLKALGSFLNGSGWTEAIATAAITTAGTAESLLTASHVRRCRHMHEVSAAALCCLQHMAYDAYSEGLTQPLQFDDWCSQKIVKHPQFAYWSLVLHLELSMFVFVRSIRQSNFGLYVDSLTQLMPWFFALDRVHYARWLSVHIRDMSELSRTHPDVFSAFENGKFTVHKTHHKFSAISIDHAHEQNNAIVKGDGGVIGLTDNENALRRWTIAGPEVARLIAQFESTYVNIDLEDRHHEQRPSVQKSFACEVRSLVKTINEMGNPFEEESSDLIVLHNRNVLPDCAAVCVKNIHETGQKQYNDFVQLRLCERSVSLYDPIKRNKLSPFISHVKAVSGSQLKSKANLSSARNDAALFSQLYISCQVRDGNLEQFFEHENQPVPPSLSDNGKLRIGNKSDLLTCLDKIYPPTNDAPGVSAIVVDGAAVVQMLKPINAKTFGEYAENVFIPYICRQLRFAQRVDVVWDRYDSKSLKDTTRVKRGSGIRRQVSLGAPIPSNWQDFLRCSDNKTALFTFLSDTVANTVFTSGKQVIITAGANVLCSPENYDTFGLAPCNHEEADTRLLVHVADAVRAGHTKVIIRTVDTDVVVIAVACCNHLTCAELWLAFGAGKHLRYIPAHELCSAMGVNKSQALPIFHAVTGCDTVSAFAGRGKKTCWDTWQNRCKQEITEIFLKLVQSPDLTVVEECLPAIERFVILLYDSTGSANNVNTARKQLFCKKKNVAVTMHDIPPTQDALRQHLLRAVYQGGFVWAQALVPMQTLPEPSDWGWLLVENQWEPRWMTLPELVKSCPELVRCGCKMGCSTKRCKCVKADLPCTSLCGCEGECNI